jgi:hypothetical protein
MVSKPMEPVPPAPASTTPPTSGQESTEAGREGPSAAEQGAAAALGNDPPVEDHMTIATGGGTTGLSPSAYAEAVKRMDEVVGEIPPILLELLVLSVLSGDDWKQSKAPEADDQEKGHSQPHPEAPVGTSATVSTRES